MTLPVVRRTRQAFAWIALIPIVLTVFAFLSRQQYRESVRQTEHTAQVIRAIARVRLDLTEAETGQRGFLLTGEERYLTPFEAASGRLAEDERQLRELVARNRRQSANADRLIGLAGEKMKEIRQSMELRRSAGLERALDEVRTDRGALLMDQLSQVADEMTAEEERKLAARRMAQDTDDWRLTIVFLVSVAATPLLLVWASVLVGRFAAERDRAVVEVQQLNRDLEARVEDRTASLRRSNADLLQFAYVASHDLQEPLRMVSSYVGLLARRYQGKLDADADQFIAYAVNGARRMQTLINDLLAYSRVGTQAFSIAPTKVEDVVRVAIQDLEASIRESGAEITWGALPEVDADPVKLGLVFQNLLSNAIRFHRVGEPPRIKIQAQRDGDGWNVSVSDNGIGFDPAYREKIFVIFQRLHGSEQYAGTGIGLAICKRIVEGHGGRIWAESQPDQGATFSFYLPQHGGSARGERAAPGPQAA